ncbi:unnamed protein product, partial [Discosporangium mesarthrocarpum]
MQVPMAELAGDIAVEDMSHEPLGFLSGSFRGPQLGWATVGKEAFAIACAYRRLEWVLWRGAHNFCHHRNRAYIFHPASCITDLSKATAQRLPHWATFVGQYDYTVRHIAGERNSWGDLL